MRETPCLNACTSLLLVAILIVLRTKGYIKGRYAYISLIVSSAYESSMPLTINQLLSVSVVLCFSIEIRSVLNTSKDEPRNQATVSVVFLEDNSKTYKDARYTSPFPKRDLQPECRRNNSTITPRSPIALAMLASSEVANSILHTCLLSRFQKSDIGLH
jgi:hypothetical protein